MKAIYIDHMGSDTTVANAARVSFDNDTVRNEHDPEADRNLLRYLARGSSSKQWDSQIKMLASGTLSEEATRSLINRIRRTPVHWAPFAHPQITIRETMPISVARQRMKHVVGMIYSEVSRRYVDDTPMIWEPGMWRTRPDASIKQGSGGIHPETDDISLAYISSITQADETYDQMIKNDVAPEMARNVLPLSTETSMWVTGSLYAWANAYVQRSDSHAQLEIQELAKQWDAIIRPLFPDAWEALTGEL